LIQDKRVRRPGEVYDQVNEDIRDVLEKYGTDLNELLSQSRTRNASRARAEVCMIALERLRPLGISDCDIAKFIGIQRTTMLFSAKRWKRDNGET
jgi:chromosomal replication initiation ATPase DnaA